MDNTNVKEVIKEFSSKNPHGLSEFQKKTANEVIWKFIKENRKKVLVADEVGLGKTYVAKGVIYMMQQIKQDNISVIYMSPNEAIAKQNIETLSDGLVEKIIIEDELYKKIEKAVNKKCSNQHIKENTEICKQLKENSYLPKRIEDDIEKVINSTQEQNSNTYNLQINLFCEIIIKHGSQEMMSQRLTQQFEKINIGKDIINLFSFSPGITFSTKSPLGNVKERLLICAIITQMLKDNNDYKKCLKPLYSAFFKPKCLYKVDDEWEGWCLDIESMSEKIQRINNFKEDDRKFFIELMEKHGISKELKVIHSNFENCEGLIVKYGKNLNNGSDTITRLWKGGKEKGINISKMLLDNIQSINNENYNLTSDEFNNIIYTAVISFPFIDSLFTKADAKNQRAVELVKELLNEENKFRYNFSEEVKEIFIKMREICSFFRIKQIKPDLIILDEFHRYADKNIQEEVDKLLSTKNTKVLLLSATPYNMHISAANGESDSYDMNDEGSKNEKQVNVFSELKDVIEYLENENISQRVSKSIGKIRDEILTLCTLSSESKYTAAKWIDQWNKVVTIQKGIEKELSKYLLRTERYMAFNIYEGDDTLETHDVKKLPPEIFKVEAETYKSAVQRDNNRVMLYYKHTPWFLSFAKNYKSLGSEERDTGKKRKEHKTLSIEKYNKRKLLGNKDYLFWDGVDCNPKHFKTEALIREAMPDGIEKLLWIPPVIPYYKLEGCFAEHADFTKTLVFANHVMSTKAIAAILSKRVQIVSSDQKDFNEDIFKYVGIRDTELIKRHVKLYTPVRKDSYSANGGSNLEEIIENIKKKIKADNSFVAEGDNPHLSALIAVASPTVCAYRTLSSLKGIDEKMAIDCAKKIGDAFVEYLKDAAKRSHVLALNGIGNCNDLLRYCANGCIQSVIDEYLFMIRKEITPVNINDVCDTITRLLEPSHTKIKFFSRNLLVSDNKDLLTLNDEDFVECTFAERFTTDKSDSEDNDEKHYKHTKDSFNSPFLPFVLATTPMAQEGLDLHFYCHRIMHWGLPVSPVDFEQREGRINRRRCHLIRKRAALCYRYDDKYGVEMWMDVFDSLKQNKDLYEKNKGMYPDWYIPKDDKENYPNDNKNWPQLIRVISNHPYSKEYYRYERLKTAIDIYRLSLGYGVDLERFIKIKERAKELNKDIKDLLLNFSPAFRED